MQKIDNKFCEIVKDLYVKNGPSKPMNINKPANEPCYFLLRKFLDLNDLLIIFNTDHCPFSCSFCNLNNKELVNNYDVLAQFLFVCNKLKHSLSIVERITISNNASVLNNLIFPENDLYTIIRSLNCFKNLREIVLETNMLYVNNGVLSKIQACTSKSINILVGFETLCEEIRSNILKKPESINDFLKGLDILAEFQFGITAYILYKPDYNMSDNDAYDEALKSAKFLINESKKRNISLSLRINPMYASIESEWCRRAQKNKNYLPPKLSDVLKLSYYLRSRGIDTYIGLSTENSELLYGSYRDREDFSKDLLKEAIIFNKNVQGV